jgi:hypothetical protein
MIETGRQNTCVGTPSVSLIKGHESREETVVFKKEEGLPLKNCRQALHVCG